MPHDGLSQSRDREFPAINEWRNNLIVVAQITFSFTHTAPFKRDLSIADS